MVKWLNVILGTKWLWVWVPLQWLKYVSSLEAIEILEDDKRPGDSTGFTKGFIKLYEVQNLLECCTLWKQCFLPLRKKFQTSLINFSRVNPNNYKTKAKLKQLLGKQKPLQFPKKGLKGRLNYCEPVIGKQNKKKSAV